MNAYVRMGTKKINLKENVLDAITMKGNVYLIVLCLLKKTKFPLFVSLRN